MITYAQFLDLHAKIYGDRPDCIRLGQWAFNCLHDIDPDLAAELTATELDPFYHDKRVPFFLIHIALKHCTDKVLYASPSDED